MSRQDANAAFALSSFLQGTNATYIDELCQLSDTIALSAGERGHQMIVPPLPIAALLDAKLADLTK